MALRFIFIVNKFSAFSSVAAPLQPIVDRQAYILPGVIEAMKETVTEKGITSKHILGKCKMIQSAYHWCYEFQGFITILKYVYVSCVF
jgi:hypothetical protein